TLTGERSGQRTEIGGRHGSATRLAGLARLAQVLARGGFLFGGSHDALLRTVAAARRGPRVVAACRLAVDGLCRTRGRCLAFPGHRFTRFANGRTHDLRLTRAWTSACGCASSNASRNA